MDTTVASSPSNPALVGNQIPLVPQSIFTFQGTWAAPKQIFVAIQGRAESNEFDDDQNLLPLGSMLRPQRYGDAVAAQGIRRVLPGREPDEHGVQHRTDAGTHHWPADFGAGGIPLA